MLNVVIVGAPVIAVLAFEIAFAFANLLEHGDVDLPTRAEGWLGRVCITPALHRRHHTRTGAARDTNFGTIFSLWDRLLGTFDPSDSSTRIETGLPGIGHLGLSRALLLPVRRVVR